MGSSRQNAFEGTTTVRGRTDRESDGDKPRFAFSSPTHSQSSPKPAQSSLSHSLTAPKVVFYSSKLPKQARARACPLQTSGSSEPCPLQPLCGQVTTVGDTGSPTPPSKTFSMKPCHRQS